MNEKKDMQAEAAAKVTIKTGTIVDAYNLLNTRSAPFPGRPGFRLSALEVEEIFIVLRALAAMEPTAASFNSFRENAKEKLKPQGWDELLKKAHNDMQDMSKEDQRQLKILDLRYTRLVDECCQPEREKTRQIDSYEHLSDKSFGMLIKENIHLLDVHDIRTLREVIG